MIESTCSVCLLLTLSCNRGKVGRVESAHAENAPIRGDQVVVEQTAAVFFEGRVVAIDGQRLRVQTASNDESLSVAASDAYRLASARMEQRPGRFAICGPGPAEWVACRVEGLDGANVRVVDAMGQASLLTPERVLSPTPVTELNLRRHFERASARATFIREVERAGRPQPPAGWKPAARDRVLAHHAAGWYTGRIEEVDDEAISVVWEADKRTSELTLSQVVPEPPYSGPLKRGDFVLVRPPRSSEAWTPTKVVAVVAAELDVLDVNGERRRVPAREIVPLGRP
jgi:hypothetical protein